jgi:hypothetical protein
MKNNLFFDQNKPFKSHNYINILVNKKKEKKKPIN